jgi:D-ribose pyranase
LAAKIAVGFLCNRSWSRRLGIGCGKSIRKGGGCLLFETEGTVDPRANYRRAKRAFIPAKGDRTEMIRGGILHPGLNRILSETGHTDILTICDRGFPVPTGPERLDLALVDNIPTVLDVLSAIHKQFVIDRIIITEEMEQISPDRAQTLRSMFPDIKMDTVSHQQLKEICRDSRAVIRTGDTVPYANIMIISG